MSIEKDFLPFILVIFSFANSAEWFIRSALDVINVVIIYLFINIYLITFTAQII
jgi:hypothetical protein